MRSNSVQLEAVDEDGFDVDSGLLWLDVYVAETFGTGFAPAGFLFEIVDMFGYFRDVDTGFLFGIVDVLEECTSVDACVVAVPGLVVC